VSRGEKQAENGTDMLILTHSDIARIAVPLSAKFHWRFVPKPDTTQNTPEHESLVMICGV